MQIRQAGRPICGRNDPRIHTQETFNYSVGAGLFGYLTDHRIEWILTLLDPSSRKSPGPVTIRRNGQYKEHATILHAHRVSSQP